MSFRPGFPTAPTVTAGAAAAVLLGAALLVPAAHARLIEEQLKVPVRVTDAHRREVEHTIVVTVFRDDAAPRPYPVLVLNHGRSYNAEGRAAVGRARYSAASRWLTEFGFLVAVPTRIGYGVTGGEDVENSGPCNRKNYPPVYQAAAAQTLRVLEVLRARPDVAQDRAIVMGQSFGGVTAIAVAALAPGGVQGAINFAGGGGGRPHTHPEDPCAPSDLVRLFAGYGSAARMPTLWIYTENDRYFGPRLPREWFQAFRDAGGRGEFVQFPPHGEDGHSLFTRAPELWQPRVLAFLGALGYRPFR